MEDEIGLYGEDMLEVYILPSPLRGDIMGGARVARRWNTNVTVDARSFVQDPDVEPGDHSGMTWT